MKILLCAHDRPNYINGPNVWLQRLLPELSNLGVSSKVLFFQSGDPSECETIQALKNSGIECKIYTGKGFTEYRMSWILQQIKLDPPDIFIPNLDIPAYHVSKHIKDYIPTIGILHSDDPFYHAIFEEFVQNEKNAYLSALVCVSRHLEDICKKKADTNPIQIERISYCVPIPEKKAELSSGNTLKLIYAGRLEEKQKRISDVTRGLCRVVREIPGTEAVLYGSGKSKENLRNIIQEENVGDKVKLGGLVDNNVLQNKLLESQVFVLLSDFEGLPIALMEAMAYGLVPVCYNMASGIPELVTDGKTGLIVNDREDDFVDAIKRLSQNPEFWNEMSKNSREKIDSEFSISYTAKRWRELFNELKFDSDKNDKTITIPWKLDLPARHPDISTYEDRRWPGYIRHYGSIAKQRILRTLKNNTKK